MNAGPFETFTEVKGLIDAGAVDFSSTARKDLEAHYGTKPQGVRRALEMLRQLQAGDYNHSEHLPNPPADCDVYGMNCDNVQWYIKFFVDVEFDPPYKTVLYVVSFHEERSQGKTPLKARRKVVLP